MVKCVKVCVKVCCNVAERGERHQVGPPGQSAGLVFRRHDTQGGQHLLYLVSVNPHHLT